jgi:uncharacterized damage-inducible protein DinB
MLQGVTRPQPPETGDERAMLTVWLDYQRATLLWKCEGLDGEDLVRRGVPPSSLSLLGIVRHMDLVEWHWFDHIFSGTSIPPPMSMDEDRDEDFNELDPELAMADIEHFQERCDRSRSIVAAADSLDTLAASTRRGTVSLRWIMIHMIEEYARHNGHSDLLREQIDGAVGE